MVALQDKSRDHSYFSLNQSNATYIDQPLSTIIAKKFRKTFTHMHTAEKRMDVLHTPLGHIQLNNMMLTEKEPFLSMSQLLSPTHLNILWRVSRDVASQ